MSPRLMSAQMAIFFNFLISTFQRMTIGDREHKRSHTPATAEEKLLLSHLFGCFPENRIGYTYLLEYNHYFNEVQTLAFR